MSSRIHMMAAAILTLSTSALGNPLAHRDTSQCPAVSVTTTTVTVPVTILSTSTFTPPSSITTEPINSSVVVIETSVQATASSPAQTSASAIVSPQNCHHNNCLRQFLRHSQVTAFCATYTTTINLVTTNIPDYVSQCHADPSRISSACSCIVTGAVAPTSDVAQTSAVIQSSAIAPTSDVVQTTPIAASIAPATSNITSTSAEHHTRSNDGTFTTRTHHHHHSHSAVPATSSFESGMCFASIIYETFTETTTYLITLTGSSSMITSNTTTIAPVVSSAMLTSGFIMSSASVVPHGP
ncbi:hypothetical protein BDZ45DRAFT_679615 [Acephala macrosclerotiorum]|nr:hypothetical protein BDZ45DRAFT_679615 [Acephala macrosclerotiorum]